MAVGKSNLDFILVVSCLLMLILTGCQSSQPHFNKHVALFIFGDSVFDAGNNNYINTVLELQANFWPYGESYFNPPSGRFSDGRIIPDFIAEFAGLPLIPAYLDPHNNEFLYGANFASAGAGILVETKRGSVIGLKTQLQYFADLVKLYRQNLGDAKTEQLLSDAIYLFSCGGNDYEYLLINNDSSLHHHERGVEMVIGNLTDVLKGIHEKGGRKFGIGTLSPLGCTLSNRAIQPNNTCNEEQTIVSSLHDNALSKKLQELEQQLEGFMYAKYDLGNEIIKRMNSPSKYGFKVGDCACCGSGRFRTLPTCGRDRRIRGFELCDNPSDYLYFDAYHPSEAANRQLAEQFWNGDSKVTSPYNLKALFQGHRAIKTGTTNVTDVNAGMIGICTGVCDDGALI